MGGRVKNKSDPFLLVSGNNVSPMSDSHQEPSSEKSTDEGFSIPEISRKTEDTERLFRRFKILTVSVYSIMGASVGASFFILPYIGSDLGNLVKFVIGLSMFPISIMFLYHLWKCSYAVNKKPLYYLGLVLLVPLFGALWAYSRLKSHYDDPFSGPLW